jgi:hypothetical protein
MNVHSILVAWLGAAGDSILEMAIRIPGIQAGVERGRRNYVPAGGVVATRSRLEIDID